MGEIVNIIESDWSVKMYNVYGKKSLTKFISRNKDIFVAGQLCVQEHKAKKKEVEKKTLFKVSSIFQVNVNSKVVIVM